MRNWEKQCGSCRAGARISCSHSSRPTNAAGLLIPISRKSCANDAPMLGIASSTLAERALVAFFVLNMMPPPRSTDYRLAAKVRLPTVASTALAPALEGTTKTSDAQRPTANFQRGKELGAVSPVLSKILTLESSSSATARSRIRSRLKSAIATEMGTAPTR